MENHDKPQAIRDLEERVTRLEEQNEWLRARLAEIEARVRCEKD